MTHEFRHYFIAALIIIIRRGNSVSSCEQATRWICNEFDVDPFAFAWVTYNNRLANIGLGIGVLEASESLYIVLDRI